jgi:uncharacterized protein
LKTLDRLRITTTLLLALAAAAGPVAADSAADTAAFSNAVHVDDARTVRTMLAAGFDPNTPDEKGQRPLLLAMRDESFGAAALLLAHPGLKIDATNAAGETALMHAAIKGRLDWVKRLLDAGAAPDREGWTPLHYAACGPDPAVVGLLLDRGARIEAPSPNRTTALMMAARYGDERSVDLLLARGADLRARNDLGLTVTEFAQRSGRDRLAARLAQLAAAR